MNFLKTLFSTTGLLIVVYILIEVFFNTASPQLPTTGGNIHSWVQYFLSVLFWPLSFWTPTFNVGKWAP